MRLSRFGSLLALWLLPGVASAAIFTAGPHGAHPTIQGAIDAALAAAAVPHEVRIERGTYGENLALPSGAAPRLTVSGGWNAAFTSRTQNPADTVIDGGDNGRVLDAPNLVGGTLVLRGLTLRDGEASHGGALRLELRNGARVELQDCAVRASVAHAASAGRGGGVFADLRNTSRLTVSGCVVAGNRAQTTEPNDTQGAGLHVLAADAAQVTIDGNDVRGNTAAGSGGRYGGIYLVLAEGASAVVTDNQIVGNVAKDFAGGGLFQATIEGSTTGTLEVRRNRWIDNDGSISLALQLAILTTGNGTVHWSDDLVASGVGGAIVGAHDDSVIRATNLTVTGQEGTGLLAYRLSGGGSLGGDVSVFNSIIAGNSTDIDLPAFVERGSNLIGGDPRFVAPAAGDYDLRPDSPALDAGVGAPPGGLGPTDLPGGPRVVGPAVDLGAFELDEVPVPPLPSGPFLTDPEFPGFRFKVRIGSGPGAIAGKSEPDCLPETLCVSGAIVGRTEVLVRIVGPKPNGYLWPTLVKLTTSQVEVWIEQVGTGELRYYRLAGATPGVDELPGLFDRTGFLP